MKHPGRATPRVRLVLCRGSLLMKAALAAAIVLSTAALLTLSLTLAQTRRDTRALQAQAAALEAENSQLEENIAGLGTVQSVIRIAGEELDLVDPNTVLLEP